MQRIRTARFAEVIGEAIATFPAGIEMRLRHVHYLAGVDPVFVGLHGYEQMSYARSYRTTAHVCFPMHLTRHPRVDRVTTVVLPVMGDPAVVVHELGHALHATIGLADMEVAPVTEYASTDPWEAFAEAFAAWLCPSQYVDAQDALMRDQKTLALFTELAAC